MSEVRDTGCTFKGCRVLLETDDENYIVKSFKIFTRKLAESRFPPEGLKPQEKK